MTSEVALKLGRADHGRPVGQAEFAHAVYEEPWRYERVRGRLEFTSPSGNEHALPTDRLRSCLGAYEVQRPEIVWTSRSEAWIRIDEATERIADVAVYLQGRREQGEPPDRVPELVFEVVSEGSSRRDYIDKREEYFRAGVLEYAILDMKRRRLTILRPSPDGSIADHVLGPGDVYQTPLLPGFAMPVDKVLS